MLHALKWMIINTAFGVLAGLGVVRWHYEATINSDDPYPFDHAETLITFAVLGGGLTLLYFLYVAGLLP